MGVVLITACTVGQGSATTLPGPFDSQHVVIGDTSLAVWVAATREDRQQGLMGVEELPPGIDGMLFVFDDERPRSFWMLNTLIPLDIWWFDAGGVLLGSTFMEPCTTDPCPSYPSPGPTKWALETAAGEFEFPSGSILRP